MEGMAAIRQGDFVRLSRLKVPKGTQIFPRGGVESLGMASQLQYVVLCSDRTSYAVDLQGPFMEWGKQKQPRFDLGKLLALGWIPIRESAMGEGEHYAYSLILLQKPG
jgi:hypothetical protein